MDNGFSDNNPIWDFLFKLGDLVILNLLFLLCSLPIVTVGASYSALYYAIVKSVRHGRGYAVKNFFHAFKLNLLQGTGGFILLGVLAWFSSNGIVSYFAASSGDTSGQFMLWMSVAITFIVAATACMLFPILSRFSFDFKTLMGISMVSAFRYIHYSLVFVALAGVIVYGTLVYSFYVIPAVVLILPALYAYITSFMMERVLRVYQRQIESGQADAAANDNGSGSDADADAASEDKDGAEAESSPDASAGNDADEKKDSSGNHESAEEESGEDNPLLKAAGEESGEKYVDKWYNEDN